MRASTLFTLVGVGIVHSAMTACGGDARAAGPVVRDSAGVRIVENSAPLWKEGEEWRVAAEPSLDIGVVEGAPAYQLDKVRGAVRLSDGRIVVANGGSKELRFFDAGGKHLASAGREGGGPGEFSTLSWIGRGQGDSVLAWDFRSRRLSVFTARGEFARSVTPEGLELLVPTPVGTFADGSFVTPGGLDFSSGERKEGEYRDSTVYLRFAAGGKQLGRLGPFGATENFRSQSGPGASLTSNVVFGRRTMLTLAGDRLYAGENGRYEIREYTPEGALRAVVRREHEPVAVNEEDVRRHFEEEDRESDLSGFPPAARAQLLKMKEEQRAKLPHRNSLPAYADVEADEAGNLWVEEYRKPGDGQPRWSVFDPEGRWLGTVSTPAGLDIYQIGTDWILGRTEDELDVQHVRLYRLEKPGSK